MPIQQEQLQRAVDIAREYGATRLLLFGSAATMPEEANDLDLACDGIDGWKFYALGAKLEEELRMSVDLVALTPQSEFTRAIEKDSKSLL